MENKYSETCLSWPLTVLETVVNISKWSTYTDVSQNNFHTRILFPGNYLWMHIEIAHHINGDSYGQKKNLFIYITTDLHEQHFFASFWNGKKLM